MHSDAHAQVEAALYVVATPLGNLRDITLRALDVLGSVNAIAAEDTRLTRRLLHYYGVRTRLLSVREHNEARAAAQLVQRIQTGESIAYVTDAGTPAISDPGALLVRRVRDAGLRVIPVPGPSAIAAALSAAGVPASQFLFYGFLPAKAAARREALRSLAALPYLLVMYEAPHRLADSLEDMASVLGADRELVIARELTKLFESFHRCRLGEARAWLDGDANRLKGEFVLMVQGAAEDASSAVARVDEVLCVLLEALPLSQAVDLATRIAGGKRNALYARALELRRSP